MLIDVIDVKPQDNFLLLLEFENGEKKEFDCKSLFGYKVYKPLNLESRELTKKVLNGYKYFIFKVKIYTKFCCKSLEIRLLSCLEPKFLWKGLINDQCN